jgi:hypothetical protein
MWSKILLVASTLLIAFTILFASILRTASVRYEFSPSPSESPNGNVNSHEKIDYFLAYPGRVLPDSPFWPLKALRDKIWLLFTTDSLRLAELKLLFADKRIGSSQILFKKGKVSLGLSTLTKAEKYLEEATLMEEEVRKSGIDTSEFLLRLSKASLKHYEITQSLLEIAPGDVKPLIVQTQEYSKKSFERARNGLLEKGKEPLQNPFTW